MKFYYASVAPNPTRVLTYIREKQLTQSPELELLQVSLLDGEHRSEQHLARNPSGTLPVLALDDGTFLTESLTIMQYLEERFPKPCMIGDSTVARARALEAERKVEMDVFLRIVRLVHATNSPLGLPANPGIAESENRMLPNGLSRTDAILSDREFMLGDQVTIADCTLFAGFFFGEFFGWNIPVDYPNLIRWYEMFKQRPSAQL